MTEEVEDIKYWQDRPLYDQRRDWYEKGENWIEDYRLSVGHPHREVILEALRKVFPFDTLLELGCNCGPNLLLLREKFNMKDSFLAGIDANQDAINKARELLPAVDFQVKDLKDIDTEKKYDVVLADAVLIYAAPGEINEVLDKMSQVAQKAIVLCEWFDEDLQGVIKDGHWARNYEKLLEERGFKVEKIKITDQTWPNKSGNWARNGYVFVAVRV